MPSVVVLGAGPAGVGAAHQLASRQGMRVTVIERGDGPGGNAGSFELAGVPVDYGSHRLHSECAPEILADLRSMLGGDLQLRPRYGRIRLRGRWIGFPLRPLDLLMHVPPAFAIGAAKDLLTAFVRKTRATPNTFAGVLQRNLGSTICEDFYFPYAEKVWGVPPDELSPVQARRRVGARSVAQILRRLLPGERRRRGAFYYPRGGYGRIAAAYASEAACRGARFEYGATVEAVEVPDGNAVAVRARRGDETWRLEADHVWSTLPMNVLARIVEPRAPEKVLRAADALEFRGIVLVYVVLATERFSPYDAHYFPERAVRISRLSEPKNYSAATEPGDRTVLCAELPCAAQDDVWRMGDADLGALVRDDLARAGIPIVAPVLDVVTRRVRNGYPIYRVGFEKQFDAVDRWLGAIDGLLTFGRQGLYAHDNTHHALAMAYAAAASLHDDGKLDHARWAAFRTEFDRHVVVD